MISHLTGASIRQDPEVLATTEGGVTFTRFEGVMLDAGWGKGEVAFRKYPDADSTFRDRGGRTCAVPNREIFDYRDRFRPVLAFGSDSELARFLGARCGPEFDVAPLLGGPRRADQSVLESPRGIPPPPPRPQPRP
jgi:hypothetical protein